MWNLLFGVLMDGGVVETKECEKELVQQVDENKQKLIELPAETLAFFGGDEIRARVFYEKYSLRDPAGDTVEKTPKEMWDRVATAIASAETTNEKIKEWEEKFRWLLYDFKFIPGGRIMFGAGQNRRSSLINCYVVPIKEDSIEGIFDWCKEAARVYSLGGGVGVDISILRPRGTPVNNSAIHSSGSVSFMNIMSETTHTIGQAGRRGALMITMSVDHPDILEFIKVKRNLSTVRYANISVRVTDEFMRAVEADGEFALRYTNKVNGQSERKISARYLWGELVKSARDFAEPGLMFWDTIKRYSPSEYNGMEVITTNPCSEQPLQRRGAACYGIGLLDKFSDNASIDWKSLEKATRYAVRFLDNVLDYNMEKHALPAQKEASKQSRRIGIGVTGLADMFVKLKIKYDTDKALAFADNLFNMIKRTAYDESCEIAREKGAFPAFDKEKHLSMPFIKGLDIDLRDKIADYGLRNVAILTIAPVGSGSVLVGTSSAIEPVFAFSYTRRSESLSQEYFKMYDPLVSEYMKLAGISDEKDLPDFFVPSHKILPEFRVKMQGIIQRHIDSAISSTVNLPKDASVEQVEQIYLQAWKAGCKGITVYREGSREGILITNEEKKRKEDLEDWSRPDMLIGKTIKLKVMQGTLYLTANFDKNVIKEVFITLGKAGSEEKSYCEAMGRLVSRYLQIGGDIKEVISSLKGIRSSSVMWDHGLKVYSVPDAIAKALELATGQESISSHVEVQTLMDKSKKPAAHEGTKMDTCPSCNELTLINESGCVTCKACGFTKCG